MNESTRTTAVYVQTNDADANEVVAYSRGAKGDLTPLGRFATGGRGSGMPHLPSQSSVVLSDDDRFLLVANAGSDDVSVFAIGDESLELAGHFASGGSTPRSVAVHEQHVYVLNTGGEPNVTGFELGTDGTLAAIDGSTRALSTADADPAQVAFSPDGRALVVTERGTNTLSTYAVDKHGRAEGPATVRSAGATPYGFDFTTSGTLVVSEAFGGDVGAAAASSYVLDDAGVSPVSESVGSSRSEVCWVEISADDRYAYVTNFGDGTISSYTISSDGTLALHEAVAATTVAGEKGVRDEALSRDGRFLYALDADAHKVFGWSVEEDGRLEPLGAVDGLPATAAGLAAA